MELCELDEYMQKYIPEELEYKHRFEESPGVRLYPDIFDTEALVNTNGAFNKTVNGSRCVNIMIHRHWRYYPHNFHRHMYIEILYMYSGCGTNITESECSQLAEGDILILPPNVWHLPKIDGDSVLVNFLVRPEFIERFVNTLESDGVIERNLRGFFGESHSKFVHVCCGRDATVREYASKLILSSIVDGANNIMTERECYLMLILLRLISAFEDKTQISQHLSTACDAIVRIHNLIASEYRTITLSEAASKLNYTKSHICRTLKENTGQTFSEVVNRLRVNLTCTMLKESSIPVMKIAVEAGYTSIEYFNRTFRRIVGMSPGEYRRHAPNTAPFLGE